MYYSILFLFIFGPVATAPAPKLSASAAAKGRSTAKSATPSKIIAPPSRKSSGAPIMPRAKSGSMIQMNPYTVVGEFIPVEFRKEVYERMKENSEETSEAVSGISSNVFGVAGDVATVVLGVDGCIDILNTGSELVYHKNGKDWNMNLATFLAKAAIGVTVGPQALTFWRLMSVIYQGIVKIPEIFPENFELTREQQGKVFERAYKRGLEELIQKKKDGKN
ncbi:hypothetical protein DdX_16815 [Ditylenchus destructor]|uniref:Uncharacterized protein n=1 Tax=Ditylenchus destructor TaxID=166010 RepID=A0AAD4QZM2_9BILA|nr:hypothetical protein DdX_16815 [Ditylenchus destructor]